jgi:predicted transcriptional regulator YheO
MASAAQPQSSTRDDGSADLILGALRGVVDGLAATFGSSCEVVLHDFRRPEASIVAIAGAVTARHVGGAMSEIGLDLLAQGDDARDKLNYVTRTPDGRAIKSSTVVLRDGSGHVVGALCVNLDVTELRLAVSSLTSLVGDVEPSTPATTIFSDDIGDVIETVIAQEEARLGRPLPHDTRRGRLEVIGALDNRGVFNLPRAAHAIANHLGVSRATVYADLNTIRGFSPSDEGRAPAA